MVAILDFGEKKEPKKNLFRIDKHDFVDTKHSRFISSKEYP